MVEIINDQQIVTVDSSALEKDAQFLLGLLGYPDFGLSIMLTSPQKIQEFNREFRNKDTVTDILSFAYHPNAKAGERIQLPAISTEEDNAYLGDIVICPEFVQKDLPNWHPQSLDEHMQQLLVHGVCHLLGYDHENECDELIMQKKEHELLKKVRQKN